MIAKGPISLSNLFFAGPDIGEATLSDDYTITMGSSGG